jgi:hypothetical protein
MIRGATHRIRVFASQYFELAESLSFFLPLEGCVALQFSLYFVLLRRRKLRILGWNGMCHTCSCANVRGESVAL